MGNNNSARLEKIIEHNETSIDHDVVFNMDEEFIHKPRYYLIFIHGTLGSSNSFVLWNKVLPELWEQYHPNTRLFIKVLTSCERTASLKGVGTCGIRMANEIIEHFDSTTELSDIDDSSPIYFSIVAHSLGGIIARNIIGHFLQHSEDIAYNLCSSKDIDETPLTNRFWNRVIPHSYYSLATPHLGVVKPGETFLNFIINTVGCRSGICGLSGHELILNDPAQIYLHMSEPEGFYMRAFAQFRCRTLCGSTHYDHMVPFSTSMIRPSNPYPVSLRRDFRPYIVGMHGFEKNYLQQVEEEDELEDIITEDHSSKELDRGGSFLQQLMQNEKVDWSKYITTLEQDIGIDFLNLGIDDDYLGELWQPPTSYIRETDDRETDNRETDNRETDNRETDNTWHHDDVGEIAYPTRLLTNLNTLKYRRIAISFGIGTRSVMTYDPHHLWVRLLKLKTEKLERKIHLRAGEETVNVLARLVVEDHIDEN